MGKVYIRYIKEMKVERTPKYSILIPTRNSVEYLKDSINSVISQDFTDYELIVSDNCSVDNTCEYVKSIENSNIRLLKTPEPMEMSDHYEWVLAQAQGEWVIILGTDDGVMPYFFKLLEHLTKIAKSKGVNVINSVRAYFFWKGDYNDMYGNCAVDYSARAIYRIRFAKWSILEATIGNKFYIDLPQMYTTSIVNKIVIEKCKNKNEGMFYSLFPPDANGAANICLMEDRYLESLIPISWVGTSSRSSFKSQRQTDQEIHRLLERWPPMAGKLIDKDKNLSVVNDFKLYLFAALLSTKHLQTGFQKRVYNSKFFRTLLFANLYHNIKYLQQKQVDDKQLLYLEELININKIKFKTVVLFHKTFRKITMRIFSIIDRINRKLIGYHHAPAMYLRKTYPLDPVPRLMDASNMIKELDRQNNFIERFIREGV
jgi:glycosyltransferase involved in cell wall biosynthesis